MKYLLLPIKPEYLVDILNGKKTIEIRKYIPKCKLPIGVLCYCSKGKNLVLDGDDNKYYYNPKCYNQNDILLNGTIVGKFTLNQIEKFDARLGHPRIYCGARVSDTWCLENNYYDKDYCAYAWHIDNLITFFDKPKKLSDYGIEQAPQTYWYVWVEE